MFTITKEWIETNKTPAGGYNRAQLAAIGVDWPPRTGWKSRLIGTQISASSADAFISASGKNANKFDNANNENHENANNNNNGGNSRKLRIINAESCEPVDVFVYTDGACINNGKSNARAAIGVYFGKHDPLNVSLKLPPESLQTNNVAELTAIKCAYNILLEMGYMHNAKTACIVTDSDYAIKCLTTYGDKCSLNNWKKDIPNRELVREIYELLSPCENLRIMHINSHTGLQDIHSVGNEGADRLASMALMGI